MAKIGGNFGEKCGIYIIMSEKCTFFAKRFGDMKKKC